MPMMSTQTPTMKWTSEIDAEILRILWGMDIVKLTPEQSAELLRALQAQGHNVNQNALRYIVLVLHFSNTISYSLPYTAGLLLFCFGRVPSTTTPASPVTPFPSNYFNTCTSA